MSKRILLLILSLGIVLSFVGCGFLAKQDPNEAKNNETDTEDIDTGNTDGSEADDELEMAVNNLSKGEYNLDEHVKLGQYKGVEVTVEKRELTEEDIDMAIQTAMAESGEELTEVSDRGVKKGDTVNIDFEGIKDGEPFEGGAGEDFNLLIGSGTFIPGFEEQLIGANKGDELELDITFPENYHSEELAGEDVIFKVTVNLIQIFEMDEEYVKNNTEHDTIEKYRETVAEILNAGLEQEWLNLKRNSVFQKVVDDSEIISIPQTLYDFYKEDLRVYYINFAQVYGMDFDTMLDMSDMTQEDFDEMADEYAEAICTQELILEAVIAAEDITLSEDEFLEEAQKQALQNGFSNAQEFIEAQGNEDVLREIYLNNKAFDFIVSEAIEI